VTGRCRTVSTSSRSWENDDVRIQTSRGTWCVFLRTKEETFGVEELYLSFFEYFSCSELGLRGIAGSPGDLCGW